MFVLCFRGDKHDALPKPCTTRWHRQLMRWLASLTLENEARQELGLPRVVYAYEDIFSDELRGLPSHRDVDFTIEFYPGTSPISMTLHIMSSIEL